MYKKALSLGFVVSLLVPSLALARFADINDNYPYAKAVDYVQMKGIVGGYSTGYFSPYRLINRAEFLKILMKTRFTDAEVGNCNEKSYLDVPTDQWYSGYICLAKKKGIVSGYPDGTFRAENGINFSEAAKILANTLRANDKRDTSLTQWYEPYVQILANHNTIPVSVTGFEYPLLRGDMAEMIYRLNTNTTNLSSLTLKEIGQRQVIDKYYENLSFDKKNDAYAMKIDPGMTLEAFLKLYKDFPRSHTDSFEKIGPSKYKFVVITSPNISSDAQNQPEERFKVSMEVVDGKLRTLSSVPLEKQVLEVTSSNGTKASLEWEKGVYNVYLIRSTSKDLVDTMETKVDISSSLNNLVLSPTGRYLTLNEVGWEYGGLIILDTQIRDTQRIFNGDFYGYTPGEKSMYVCGTAGIGSGSLAIYTFPGLSHVDHPEPDETHIWNCGPYDANSNTLYYQTMDNNSVMTDHKYKM